MFQSRVIRSREDEVGEAGLTDPPQSLERRVGDQFQQRRIE